MVSVPNVNYDINLGIPKDSCFACLAETILLTIEGHSKNYSIGKVKIDKAEEMWRLALKHNFSIAPFRSFGEIIEF